jgi:class 3 adenylate cyclase/DNA-binding winged helix-turn-helix (wHTH) protein/tetratricopeptide (TPR) repeat protein
MRYVFGDYTLDTRHYELRLAGVPIPLRPKVFHLLAYLLAQRDRIVPRQELCEHLWPHQFVSDTTLDACLAQARQAVGDSGRVQRVIQTRHGYGYRVVAPVEVHDDPSDDSDQLSTSASPHEFAKVEPAQGHAGAAGVPVLVPEVPREPPLPRTSLRQPPPHATAGERKVVTVLVCALANEAALAQRPEAEALHQGMQAFFALVLEEVERYGGTLQRMLDDGALVLFGAPLAHEDHAQRAVLAALRLQQRLHAFRPEPPPPLGEAWSACIGLHTGQLIIGHLGDDGRLTFTSVGDTTHLAAGLAQRGAPGTILVSEATARLVQDAVRLEAVPLVPRPGQSHPGKTYKVLGRGLQRAPLLRHMGRSLSPFVGRQLELATLRALLTRIEAGQGQVVSLVGEPGMGKTRLVYEFWHGLQRTQVTFLEGRCDSYSQAIPYLPLQEIVRQACGVTGGEPSTAITARMHQHHQNLGMAAAEEAPYLLHLLGVPDATTWLARVSPQAIRLRTFAALHQLLLRQSQRQPLLVVVENLHWIDPTSQEYLTELVEQLAGIHLLLLVTCRPGYRPPWMDKSYATQLTLPQLGLEESQRVVQAVLPARPLPERLLQDILARAVGNPLFLEELAWAVREHGDLRLRPEIPTTLQAVLAARIDGLLPEAKQLLQTAAVVGPEVPRPVLQAVADMAEDELRRALRQLQVAEFLYETRLVPESTYTFKHALTHEVAYGGLLQERRRVLHARIVEALEAFYANRLAEQVDRLAYHAFRGEVWDKALAYYRQAGARAEARSAYREAVACFEQALNVLVQLPEHRNTLEQAIDLRFDLHNALTALDEYPRVFDHLRSAEALAARLGDDRRLVRIAGYLCTYFSHIGEHDQAIAAGEHAFALATSSGLSDVQVEPQIPLGQAYYSGGDFRRALDYGRRTMALLTGELRYARFGRYAGPTAGSRRTVAWSLAELGEFAEGRAVAEDAVQIAGAVADPHVIAAAFMAAGLVYRRQGDFRSAIPVLERILTLAQSAHVPRLFPMPASSLSAAYALAGRVAEALTLLDQARERVATGHPSLFHEVALTEQSEALLLVGCVAEATALAGRLLDLSHTHIGHGHQAHAFRLLGEIAVRQSSPDIDQAECHYRRALALAEEPGMRPLQAHCHLGLGTLYATIGRWEPTRAHLSAAIELYRAMDMTFWLPHAEAALAQVEHGSYHP